MTASVLAAAEEPDEFDGCQKRGFGIELAHDLPRVFAGGQEAKAFFRAFAALDESLNHLGWNPFYGRRDLAPIVIREGRKREGYQFQVQIAFRGDGTVLRTLQDLFYGVLESPRAVYHKLTLPLFRITEFQTFVASMIADPARHTALSRHFHWTSETTPGLTLEVPGNLPLTVTLWNYDLPSADPTRLMTPTHAAWFLKARRVGQAVLRAEQVAVPTSSSAWDVDGNAFVRALESLSPDEPGTPSRGLVSIPSTLVDESPLISTLLRDGSRLADEGISRSGDLLVDRYYQTIHAPKHRPGSPSYGAADLTDESKRSVTMCACRQRIPVKRARTLEELSALVQEASPLRPHGRLLLRGQNRHYAVPRPHDERLRLYGHPDANEVSLLTCASRDGLPYESFFGEFQLYLQGLLYEDLPLEWLQPNRDPKTRPKAPFLHSEVQSRYRSWKIAYGESFWDFVVMGLAQHYGVPTLGLDLTHDLETAVWFALNRYFTHSVDGMQKAWYRPIDDWESATSPVVYVVEVDGTLMRNLSEAVNDLAFPVPLRVQRQSAYLHYGGWGLQANACAEDVRMAVFLESGFERLPTPVSRLFPGSHEDLFYGKMLWARTVATTIGRPSGFGRIVEYQNPLDAELYRAANRAEFDEVRRLLALDAGVHYSEPTNPSLPAALQTNAGLTALHWAAFYGDTDLVVLLLEKGADIESVDMMGRRPLVCAAMRGHSETTKRLLQKAASLDALRYYGWTALPPKQKPPAVVAVLAEFGYHVH